MHRMLRTILALALLTLPVLNFNSAIAEDTTACFSAIYSLNENRLDEAIDLYTQCIEKGDLGLKNLIVAYNDRGNAHGKKSDLQSALADFNKVIELNPEDPDAFYNRGLTYKKLAKIDRAFRDYSEAIKRNPRYAKAYNNRGAIYGQRGEFYDAITDFNHAIFLTGKNASAFYNRGLAYYSLGEYKNAISDLERAIELNPKYIKAYENLAWLRATCPDNELRDGIMAIALARKVRFMQPEGTSTLFDIMAAAYASSGSYEDAIRYQELAIETAPGKTSELIQRLDLYQDSSLYRDDGGNKFLPRS